jgi:hypothetical protein
MTSAQANFGNNAGAAGDLSSTPGRTLMLGLRPCMVRPMCLIRYVVVIDGDPDGVYPRRAFDDFLSAVDYGISILTPWATAKGCPGIYIIGNGPDYDDKVWTLERLRAIQMIAGRAA